MNTTKVQLINRLVVSFEQMMLKDWLPCEITEAVKDYKQEIKELPISTLQRLMLEETYSQ